MRIRSIKPEFWRSDDITGLSWETRLIFIGLWSYVDDNGVGIDDERRIVADLFAFEEDVKGTRARVHRALDELSRALLVSRYVVDGRQYVSINGWQHQKIDRPSKARYPQASEGTPVIPGHRDTLATSSRVNSEGSMPEQWISGAGEQGNRDQGSRGPEEQSAPSAEVATAPQPPAPTVNQRAQQLATTYTDQVPLSKFPAVLGIAKKAIQSGRYDDDQIRAGLLRLAAEGRSLTVETLRIELDGQPPPGRPPRDKFVEGLDLARRMAQQQDHQHGPPRQIGA